MERVMKTQSNNLIIILFCFIILPLRETHFTHSLSHTHTHTIALTQEVTQNKTGGLLLERRGSGGPGGKCRGILEDSDGAELALEGKLVANDERTHGSLNTHLRALVDAHFIGTHACPNEHRDRETDRKRERK